MQNTPRRRKPVSAEAIARLADDGRDVSRFFNNNGRIMGPIQRVNVDLASGMLEELDRAAKELNISRQAVIKTLIRQALDQQYLARGEPSLWQAEVNACGKQPCSEGLSTPSSAKNSSGKSSQADKESQTFPQETLESPSQG